MSLLKEFYEEYDIKPFNLQQDKTIIDPGVKSVKSLASKVHRYVDNFGWKDYKMKDVSDISRCTVLVDSYEQVPSIIKQIKEYSPNATGYISECPNGYKGIHLNFTKDGVATEIQICTEEVFLTGQATEVIYQKWREFNFSKELKAIRDEEKLLGEAGNYSAEAMSEIRQKKVELYNKLQEYNYDYERCYQVYEDALESADFGANRKTIEAQLQSMTYSKQYSTEQEVCPEPLKEVLNEDFRDANGNIDEQQLLNVCENFNSLAKETHSKTMAQLEHYVEASMDSVYEPSNLEKNINKLSRYYDEQIMQYMDNNVYVDNISFISRDKSKFIQDILKNADPQKVGNMSMEEMMFNFENSNEIELSERIQEFAQGFVKDSSVVKIFAKEVNQIQTNSNLSMS